MKFLVSIICVAAALLCIEATISDSGSGTWADRQKLRKELFTDYDKMTLPENVTFKYSIALINFDLNVDKNIFEVNSWGRYSWNDQRLVWDETKTSVKVLRVGIDEVWTPDMVLYNGAHLKNVLPCGKTNALIYPTGNVLWVPPCNHEALCDLTDLKDNPRKTVQCELNFGSWTLDGYSMDLKFYGNNSNVDLTDFKDLSEWKIVSSQGERVEKYYECCTEPYISIKYKFDIQKKSNNPGKCTA